MYHPAVIPTVVIERVSLPGGEELVLSKRGKEFAIRVAGVELMSSRTHNSEDDLGRDSAARVKAKAPRVMIGGLGMGFTLRAALDALPADASVEIVEIVPEVVKWNRTVLGGLAGHPLDDPRVTLIQDDVGNAIERGRGYDAIVLDVDNGPEGVYEGNNNLYKRRGLDAAHTALVPGGLLAVWSSFDSPTFTHWLSAARFVVEKQQIKSRGGRHTIWYGVRA